MSVALANSLRSACQGVGLIEILVTMLLLSVGYSHGRYRAHSSK